MFSLLPVILGLQKYFIWLFKLTSQLIVLCKRCVQCKLCNYAYIYLYHRGVTFTLEICGVFLQSKPFNNRLLLSSKLS